MGTRAAFGSAGRLESMLVMDFLGKYPDDPQQTFFGENNTVSVLGQEAGHRWLVFMEFRDHTGTQSRQLLGRDPDRNQLLRRLAGTGQRPDPGSPERRLRG